MTTNLRTLTCQCSRVMSGMTTCSREPSGRTASTNGLDRSTRRPDGLEHPLDEVAHLVAREHRRGQLGYAAARDEHPRRLVDPDLLDGRVVEVLLQRTEPGDGVPHRLLGLARRRRGPASRRASTARRSRRPRRAPAAAPPWGRAPGRGPTAGSAPGPRPRRCELRPSDPSPCCSRARPRARTRLALSADHTPTAAMQPGIDETTAELSTTPRLHPGSRLASPAAPHHSSDRAAPRTDQDLTFLTRATQALAPSAAGLGPDGTAGRAGVLSQVSKNGPRSWPDTSS